MVEEVITPQGISQARRSPPNVHATHHLSRWHNPAHHPARLAVGGPRPFRPGQFSVSGARIVALAFEAAQCDPNYPEEPFEEKLRYHLSVGLTEGVCWSSDYIKRRANGC